MADLILSTNKAYASADLIKVRQDDYGQTITALITDKTNSPIDLSKSDITFNIKDWNGEIISDSAKGDASGNVTYTINKNVALATGSAWFEIKNDNNRVATQTFWLQVEEAGVQEIQLADPLGGIK
ncbi:BppU family phage baseplate upper protein [Lactobacillus crispatus]|uniref:BppU family phage baseplate upper protein n=1 Tax=Lactobacillus crispatus TaxID=47770 RepID=UPI0019580A03|nr:BppU family phage baseplate upper protein [Lactobacillus crispatus]MBM6873504.1 BppU family phage baseplate upper protein [Lactobacillus crispatus]